MRLNLLTQIGDAVKDRWTQASLAADLHHIAILRITPHRPDTKGRIRDFTERHERGIGAWSVRLLVSLLVSHKVGTRRRKGIGVRD